MYLGLSLAFLYLLGVMVQFEVLAQLYRQHLRNLDLNTWTTSKQQHLSRKAQDVISGQTLGIQSGVFKSLLESSVRRVRCRHVFNFFVSEILNVYVDLYTKSLSNVLYSKISRQLIDDLIVIRS